MEAAMGGHKKTHEVIARLSRIEGHVRAVRRMVECGRPCAEVLVQMAAVRAAVDRAARVLLADHMEHCLRGAARGGRTARRLSDLRRAVEGFIR
jgi:DNA-binding FrmR family transcriptional regulator